MKNNYKYLISAGIWLLLWQLASVLLNLKLFLPAPTDVCRTLFTELIISEDFWKSIIFSLTHIARGFFTGSLFGIISAFLAYRYSLIEIFLWAPIKVMQTTPMASFVILILLWLPASKLSIIISFLMVLPTMYVSTLAGLKATDKKLLEMADVFRISSLKRLIYIYTPQILSYALSAASLAAGFAWKSGIAAEIIGLVRNSIGNRLYQAKIYFLTSELFAWTFVIIILSIAFEKLIGLSAALLNPTKEASADE